MLWKRLFCLSGIIVVSHSPSIAADKWVKVVVGPATHVGLFLEKGSLLQCDGKPYPFDPKLITTELLVPPCDSDPRKITPQVLLGEVPWLLISTRPKIVPGGQTINDRATQTSILSNARGDQVTVDSSHTLQVFDLRTGRSLSGNEVTKILRERSGTSLDHK
jgi:hypothetical protein